MEKKLIDYYEAASKIARKESISIDNVNIGSFPINGLNKSQENEIINILKKWNISGGDLQALLVNFAKEYNTQFKRNLAENGTWSGQTRLAMEIYYLTITAGTESEKARESLRKTLEPGTSNREKSLGHTKYNTIRKALKPGDNGIINLDWVSTNGEIIDVGKFNTEGYKLVEENGLLDIIKQLGFTDFKSFAEQYNSKFSHRDTSAKDILLKNANFVDQNINVADISIGNKDFMNIRLAVQIWIAYSRIPKNEESAITFSDYSFSFRDLKKIMPSLKLEQAFISTEQEAQYLEALLQLVPNGELPPFSKTFYTVYKRLEDESKKYESNHELEPGDTDDILSPDESSTLEKELKKFDPVLGRIRQRSDTPLKAPLKKGLYEKLEEATNKMGEFFWLMNYFDNTDYSNNSFKENSISQLRNSVCYSEKIVGDWCYHGG